MAGFPVVISTNGRGTPVTESPSGAAYEIAANGRGTPVIFVDSGGFPVTMVAPAWAAGVDWWRDFTTGQGNMPYPTDTHAEPINAVNSSAIYQSFALDELTRTNLGLQTVPTSRNDIRNDTMVGAVPGNPGTLPTNWVASSITPQVVGTGVENGVTYIDLRFVSGGGQFVNLHFTPTNQIAAVEGQTWTGSIFVKLISGSLPTGISQRIVFTEADNDPVDSQDFFFTPDATLTRLENTNTAVGATIVGVRNGIVSTVSAFDFTMRIGMPQLELGAFASPPIATAGAETTVTGNVQTIMNPPFNDGVCGFVTVDIRQPTSTTTETRVFEINDGTSNNRIFLFNNPANGRLKFLASVGGATTNAQEVGDWHEGPQTIAFAVAPGFFAQRRVGEANPGKFSASWPTGADRLSFGSAGYTSTLNNYQSITQFVMNFGPQNAASFDAMYARAVEAAG